MHKKAPIGMMGLLRKTQAIDLKENTECISHNRYYVNFRNS